MAKSNWDISGYINRLDDKGLEDAFNVIGSQVVSWASDNFRKRGYSPATKEKTGNMTDNLSYATHKSQSRPEFGEPLGKASKASLRIGGNVVYLARYVFGFVDKDSLGRYYNQKPRPILQDAIDDHRMEILKILQKAVNGN